MTIRTRTDLIVVHCSATQAKADVGVKEIRQWHKERGFSDIGYHYVIRRNGKIETGRPEDQAGAHVAGYNAVSLGVCLVGGANAKGRGEDNFTPAQKEALLDLLAKLKRKYPKATILGHRDLSPDLNGDGKITSNEWFKECPSFDVRAFLRDNPLQGRAQ